MTSFPAAVPGEGAERQGAVPQGDGDLPGTADGSGTEGDGDRAKP
jgi:hypothetical protein